ncbi:2-polyprenylphenol 6-hydroxylase [Devosia rhodophyticola]|uniref:2-polyprenylphenol 6-hydroxylase n=1 Tax=Devosia rhodophyticola TaxID=3026423 RepID=A0ABY7Z1E6_9HYPH|nr:2-polyprenylphenol 6-hydroxylase [Devosia rhodophyticola]WDR06924.1 2-polyprenylphenol 6-hydroxylase [Devosia rhodophyticola]
MGLSAYFRLVRAGYVLAREGAFSIINTHDLPPGMRFGVAAARLIERRAVRRTGRVERLTRALNRLGPTYVKFGQTLATRPDIVGADIAEDLSALQDRMDPFDPALVPVLLSEALGNKAEGLRDLSAPIAAASIAQVHQAQLTVANGQSRKVAVKMLRPGVAHRFMADIESYYAGARLVEKLVSATRRLKPTEIVATLDHSARLELDLRLEAASISEFAENIENDEGFVIPEIHWEHTAQNVLTTAWIEGIPIRNLAALDAAGLDRKTLATNLLQSFLKHAIRDGFFHADMHPGNLFIDPITGNIVAVDFGIMGRINKAERRFLADILYGFISRDYQMVARRHFDIGYVPDNQSIEDFALAIRSIGEPLHGRKASDISMARVLGQLFAITDLFDMQTRPELVLLQKSMVLVEGVARALDPDLNIWTTAEPVVGAWLRHEEGPIGKIEDARAALEIIADSARRVPVLLRQAEAVMLDYHAQRQARPTIAPWMGKSLFWGLMVLLLALIWRVVTV